ncbi:class I SAM-dependent methyltransferase [Candidatus Peregrinibacteria bacterium]|nr:class I SAM-dependent methyltransferase [Candidatus Peregrinibacteria bacterium]
MSTIPAILPDISKSSCASQTISDPHFDPRTIEATDRLLSLSHREEGLALYEYVRRTSGSVLEIGTYCGYLALFLAYGMKNREWFRRQGTEVFTIDTHMGHDDLRIRRDRGQPATFGRFVENCKQHNVWDIVHPIIDDADGAHALWRWGRCLDLLFIDGDHAHAKRDFRNYIPFLKPEGFVCFHNYFWECPQVIADVDELVAAGTIEPLERIHTMFIARVNHDPFRLPRL